MAANDGASFSSSGSSTYDVFLNFRGEETRNNFTGFLHRDLKRVGINVFMDSEDLWGGEEIKSALLEAIRGSKISIPVFSKGYADSKWCLLELVEIVRCHRSNGQIILPVFLDVEPSDVRHQIGSFEGSFRKHEEKFDAQTIESWKEALTVVGGITGYELKQVNGNQSKLVDLVVDMALSESNGNRLGDVKNPIGLDARVEDLLSLLNVGSNDIRFVGICGIGGIGKTTIAKALYNSIFKKFRKSCFLANIREEASRPGGLVSLQEQLIYSVSKKKVDGKIWNVHRGQELIKERLQGENVLLILDDVDCRSQLDALAIEFNWIGPGSRIIITSRDEYILHVAKVDEGKIFWPQELDDEQSLRLFSLHAFSRDQPLDDYKQLSHDVLHFAGGLPLTLEVLGSYLFDVREKEVWQSMLQKLKRIPHNEVHKKLKISYDDLEDDEKSIFLDAACFFVGWSNEIVISIWDACGFNPISAIKKLSQRSLLKFTHRGSNLDMSDSYDELRMHDQIQAMGRGIVFEESPREPGKRSRLWLHDEILEVLEEHKGTQMIEGILSPSSQFYRTTCLHREDFAMMSKLRFLQVNGANSEGDFLHLPSNLRWFSWRMCPLEIIPANFYHKNLVYMDLSESKIIQAWTNKLQNENQRFQKLKVLRLRNCDHLSESPDFSWFPCLETLDLGDCNRMITLHISIGDLKSLLELHLDGTKIEELPNTICRLSSLKRLTLSQCPSLKNLPEAVGDLTSLVELDLDGTKIEELPNSVCSLRSLKRLTLSECSSLKNLPGAIGDLKSLLELHLNGTKIEELPHSFWRLSSLKRLTLRQCSSFKNLPEAIGDLTSLVELDLDKTKIEELPNNVCSLRSLKRLTLSQCSSLKNLPGAIGDLKFLVELHLNGTKIEELPNSVCSLSSLKHLTLDCCSSLKNLHESIGDLKSLVQLSLNVTQIEQLPNSICRLSSLTHLSLFWCTSLKNLPESIGDLKSLVQLSLDETKIEELPNSICRLSSLINLSLIRCSSLKNLPESIGDLKSLVQLSLDGTQIEELPSSICMLSSLNELSLIQCSSLKKLPESIGDLKSLVQLSLNGTQIEELPSSICRLSSLNDLWLSQCSSLKNLPESTCDLKSLARLSLRETQIEELPNRIYKLSSLNYLNLSWCSSLKNLPESIGDLKSLVRLSLRGAQIEELPNSICRLSSLNDLNLSLCSSLKNLPESIGDLKSLVRLSLRGTQIEELPSSICRLSSLNDLSLSRCSSLKNLPESIGDLKSLVWISLRGVQIEELPNSICRLSSLKRLNLRWCSSLKNLPESIGDLTSLGCLSLHGTQIEELPNSICRLSSLKDLNLRFCSSLKNLPESIGDLTSLGCLSLHKTQIEELPNSICKLNSLEILNLGRYSSLKNLPESIGDLKSLVSLLLHGTQIEKLPNSICRLSSLKYLNLRWCSSLKNLPESIGDLKSLLELSLDGGKFEELPNSICSLSSLRRLNLNRCESLKKLPESIGILNSLVDLYLDGTNIKEFPNCVELLEKLEVLSVMDCSNLVKLPVSGGRMRCLRILNLIGTSNLLSPDEFLMFPSLVELKIGNKVESSLPPWISGLPRLQKLLLKGYMRLESLSELPLTLTCLDVEDCILLQKLLDLSSLKNLRQLCLSNCKMLEEIRGLDGAESLQYLDIDRCCTMTDTPRKILGQGTLLVDGLQRNDSLNVNDGTYKGLIMCLVFAFTFRKIEMHGNVQEGELLIIQLLVSASICQKDRWTDCHIDLHIKGVEFTTEHDIIYIHHFKGFDWFGLPLEGTDAIERIRIRHARLIKPKTHRNLLRCKVKFWKFILERTESEQQMPNQESSARMVKDFFRWSYDNAERSPSDAGDKVRMVSSPSSHDDGESSYDDSESSYDYGDSSYDNGESSIDYHESSYDDGEYSYDEFEGSRFATKEVERSNKTIDNFSSSNVGVEVTNLAPEQEEERMSIEMIHSHNVPEKRDSYPSTNEGMLRATKRARLDMDEAGPSGAV